MKRETTTTCLLALLFALATPQITAQTIGNPPAWNWVQTIGGSAGDVASDILSNAQGDIYLTGTFNGHLQIGNTDLQSSGLNDAFIAKYNAAGDLQWVQTLKGDSPDTEVFGQNIALDHNGNILVSGYFQNGRLVAGTTNFNGPGAANLFVTQLSPGGNFVWTNVLTQVTNDSEFSVQLLTDPQGNIFCKSNRSTYRLSNLGMVAWNRPDNGFFNANLAWSGGKLYLAGVFSTSVVLGNQSLQASARGIFICELNPLTGSPGNARLVAGSTSPEYHLEIQALLVKSADEVYIGGNFANDLLAGNCSANPGTAHPNAFVLRLGSGGCDWLLTESAADSRGSRVHALAEGNDGAIWAAGSWSGQLTLGTATLTGSSGTFLAKMEPAAGSVATLLNAHGAKSMQADSQGFLTAGSVNYAASWSRLDTDGAAIQQHTFANDGGYGIVGAVETDDTGIYLSATVSGKYKLGAGVYTAPVSSMLIAKLDHSGTQVLWQHLIANGTVTHSVGQTGYLDKSQGKFYCLGEFADDIVFNGQTYPYQDFGNNNTLLVQVDVDGSPGWLNTYAEPKTIYSVAGDASGNVLLGGTFSDILNWGTAVLNAKGALDFFLAKLNPAGELLWAQRGGGNDMELGVLVATDAQSNIYLSCESHSLNLDFNGTSALNTATGDGNILLTKYNAQGQVQWAKIFGAVSTAFDEPNCFPGALEVDAAGNIYLAGRSGQTAKIGAFSLNSPYYLNQFVAKFNPNGTPVWASLIATKRYSSNFGELDFDAAGNLYCSGQYRDLIQFENIPVNFSGSSAARSAYYARFNSGTGALDWATFIAGSPDAFIYPTSMTVVQENSLLLGGYVIDRANFGNQPVNTYSGTNGYLSLLGQDIMVATQQRENGTFQLEIYPNPASNFLHWQTPNALPEGLRATLVNSTGQQVGEGHFPGYSATGRLELQGLAPGLYYLKLTSGTTQTLRKVVVE